MNHMKDVAKLLGVELGKEFKIKYNGCELSSKYRISETGLMNESGICGPTIFTKLLTGDIEIVKPPWKPKTGQTCWYVYSDGSILTTVFNSDFTSDLSKYKLGKLYPTKAEAESHAAEDKAFWDEIRKDLEE